MRACAPAEAGRFSAEPWFRWIELTVEQSNESAHRGRFELSDVAIAARFEIARSSLIRARQHGLSWQMADEWAIKVGLHPCALWPDWLPVTDLAS